jgi:DNA-directed RNA polymerase subunit RPC12/RpoP
MPSTIRKWNFHVAEDRLREVITSAIGIHKRDTVLSPAESEHLMGCDDCIERFGNMARQVIRENQSDHEESHDVADDAVSCPNCGSKDVRPSHRQAKDWAQLLFFRTPYRCLHCYARFWRWAWKN